MRKKDPMRSYYRVFLVSEVLVLFFQLCGAISSTLAGRPNYWQYALAVIFSLLLLLLFLAFRRRHHRTEERRKRAALGDTAFLAQPQPVPDPFALPLPTMIALGPNIWSVVIFMTGFLVIFVVIAALMAFVLHASTPSFLFFLAFPMILVFVVTVVALLIVLNVMKYEVGVDDYGLTAKYQGQITFIPWHEVESFAMWNSPKRYKIVNFELTSEENVARWIMLGPPGAFTTRISMLKPDAMSFEQYHGAMARLQQVIVARSGKPLYDLRDEKLVWF